MARKKYIERIKTDSYALDFYIEPNGQDLVVLFTDKKKRITSGYHFQTVTQDWVSAIKLVNMMRKHIKDQESM